MKKGLIKKVEDIELHHRVRSFVFIVAATIIITRLIVLIHDPNPVIHGYELHHFYYGVALLVVLTIYRVLSEKHPVLYLTLSAISIGLIIDEFLFIMGGTRNNVYYLQTLPSAIIFTIVIVLITLATYYLTKRK
ncbi:Uncharacterised protein [uncultured archaeon]|nr:Uncharacterised protein [uncultured archaeon]